MSDPTYRYATTLSRGTDGEPDYCELDVVCSFKVTWGSASSGAYGPPEDYDPGSGDKVHSIKVLTINGAARPWDLGGGFMADARRSNDELEQAIDGALEAEEASMIAIAIEDEAAAEDDAADRRFREMRDEMYEDDRE